MSRPLQVVLAAAVLFAALWFVALRPKPDAGSSAPAPTPAAQPATPPSAPAKPAPAAKPTPTAKPAPVAKPTPTVKPAPIVKAAPPVTSAAPSKPAPTARAAPSAGRPVSGASAGPLLQRGMLAALPATIVRNATARAPTRRAAPARPQRRARQSTSPTAVNNALAQGKVVALLFWDRRGSDDRLVQGELRRVSNHHGRALIAAAPIRSVSAYGAVTRGVQVLQSPTVLIVDRARRARILTGYTDAAEIGQAVSEALTAR